MNKKVFDTIVLGGGISGLVAAYSLQKQGKSVLLLEKENRLGGVINTIYKEGYRLEQGPNSILTNAEIVQLINELGIQTNVRKNEEIASSRYLLFKDQPLRMKPNWKLLTSGFLDFSMGWAFFSERFRKKSKLKEESVADFIRRRLNNNILNRMISPLVTGVYAGNPEKLSLKSTFKKLYAMEQDYGSLTKAMFNRDKKAHKREAMSFDGGLITLINALGEKLSNKVQLESSVSNVELLEERFKVNYSYQGKLTSVIANNIISTLPACKTAAVFNFMSLNLQQELKKVEYAPMMLLYLAYPKQSIGQVLNGFGFLIPQQEKQPYLGGIWTSAIFPEVAKTGNHLFTLFVGGVNNKLILTHKEEAIIKAKKAFEKHMKITAEASFQSDYLVKKAIPQFNLGYYKLMEKVDRFEKLHKGLKFSGNWRTGVAIGDCVAGNLT